MRTIFAFGPLDPDNGRSENSINVVLDEVVVTGVFETDFSVQDVGRHQRSLGLHRPQKPTIPN